MTPLLREWQVPGAVFICFCPVSNPLILHFFHCKGATDRAIAAERKVRCLMSVAAVAEGACVSQVAAMVELGELHRLRIESDHSFSINAAMKKSAKEAKAAEQYHYMGLLIRRPVLVETSK